MQTFEDKSPLGNFFVRDGVQSAPGGYGLTVKVHDGTRTKIDAGAAVKKFLIQKDGDVQWGVHV